MLSALFICAAAAGGPGERLTYSVQYLGMQVGGMTAEIEPGPGGTWEIHGRAMSASWYDRIYSVNDHIISWWTPGVGSSRYVTYFREGRFQQDQDMRLSAGGFAVDRRQLRDEGWEEWSNTYKGVGYEVEDPVSAFYRLRALPLEFGVTYDLPVFTGRLVTHILAEVEARERVDSNFGERDVIRVRLYSKRKKDLKGKGRIWLWLTDDEDRVPLQVLWKSSSIGSVKATLKGWEAAAPPAEAPPAEESPPGEKPAAVER